MRWGRRGGDVEDGLAEGVDGDLHGLWGVRAEKGVLWELLDEWRLLKKRILLQEGVLE